MFTKSLNFMTEYDTGNLQAIIIGIDLLVYKKLFDDDYHSELSVNFNDTKLEFMDSFYDGENMTLCVSDNCPIHIPSEENFFITLQLSYMHDESSVYQGPDKRMPTVNIALEHWIRRIDNRELEMLYDFEKDNRAFLNALGPLY